MMTTAAATGAAPSSEQDREIVLTREFDAPRELVFRAWTEPEHLPRWMGPHGFSITTHAIDVRVGGTWSYTMHGPDGTDSGNRVVWTEITPPERLEYEHGEDVDDDPGSFHVTVRFEDLGGRTRLTMRMLLRTVAQRKGVEAFGAVELGYQTMERLAAHLERM